MAVEVLCGDLDGFVYRAIRQSVLDQVAERAGDDRHMARRSAVFQHEAAQLLAVVFEQRHEMAKPLVELLHQEAVEREHPNAAQAQNQNVQYAPILNEINNIRGEINGWKQQQESAQNAAMLNEINAFANKAEHFEEARPTMISLLQGGLAESLEEAYDKAIRLDPALYEQVQQAQQAKAAAEKSAQLNRAAKAARAAAVSVRSSTPGTNTAPKAQDRRTLLAEQFDAMSERL